jgi:hypothetical protein
MVSTAVRPHPHAAGPAVTFLTGDIGEALATARGAAGGKNLARTDLEPVSSERSGAVTILRFRVRK